MAGLRAKAREVAPWSRQPSRRAYKEVGRGAAVTMHDDAEARYVPSAEIKASLAEAPVKPGLMFVVVCATGKGDPNKEAVLALEQEVCRAITIAGKRRSAVVESVSVSLVH